MTIKIAYQQTISNLTSVFGEREAANLTRILFEDKFQILQVERKEELSEKEVAELESIVFRLLRKEPIQYLVGQANFYGLTFNVTPAVLIPRPETEELVYLLTETISTKETQVGLDIGTGSGCIPVTLKHKREKWEIHASDISLEALKVATQNAENNKTEIFFHEFDILEENDWPALPEFDFIVSNPPYIPPSEKVHMPKSVVVHEPELALFTPEDDPLLFYRGILAFAKKQLKKGGYLFFETNEFNAPEVAKLLSQNGFENTMLEKDMQGKWRMAFGRNGSSDC